MFKLAVAGSVAAFALAQEHPINQDIINEIKEKTDLWTPAEVSQNPLRFYTMEGLRGRFGTILNSNDNQLYPEVEVQATPDNFDSRQQWSGAVHPIRDQGQCGSCWAFAASEALSDRFHIASKGKIDVVLSPEDMVECNTTNQGCNGGILGLAWRYLENTGVASEACNPYYSGKVGKVNKCHTTCEDGSAIKKYKCKAGSTQKATSPAAIKTLIQQGGPVETGFTVYEDFMNYQSGIYHYVSGKQLGGHAVKILGWGVENGTKYWLCANSWSEDWGEKGFFRIKEGDSGIDNAAFGCTPDI
jgi:cathepsin B